MEIDDDRVCELIRRVWRLRPRVQAATDDALLIVNQEPRLTLATQEKERELERRVGELSAAQRNGQAKIIDVFRAQTDLLTARVRHSEMLKEYKQFWDAISELRANEWLRAHFRARYTRRKDDELWPNERKWLDDRVNADMEGFIYGLIYPPPHAR